MVDRWEPTERIKNTSFLKEAMKLTESNNFPPERETSRIISQLAPQNLTKQKTQTFPATKGRQKHISTNSKNLGTRDYR